MILANVHYHVKNGMRCEFLAQVQALGIIESSIAEDGNILYEYSLPLESPEVVCLLEIWRDEACQLAHGQTSHYKLLSGLKEKFVEKTEIVKYQIEEIK